MAVLRNKRAEFFAKRNHVRIRKIDADKRFLYLEVPAITAFEAPRILPAEDGDLLTVSPANWDQANNYTSTEGVATVTASSLTINSVAASVGDPVAAGDVLALSVTVSDGTNTRTFTSSVTVAALGNVLWGTSDATWGGVPATWGEAA